MIVINNNSSPLRSANILTKIYAALSHVNTEESETSLNTEDLTRNWLQAKLTVYPPQCADQNPVNLSKIIFSALNFFMHIYNMSVTSLPSIK